MLARDVQKPSKRLAVIVWRPYGPECDRLRFVHNGDEGDTRHGDPAGSLTGQRNPIIGGNHRQEHAAIHVASLHLRMKAPFGEPARDVVMLLRSGPIIANQEEIIAQIAPEQAFRIRARVVVRHGDEQGFCPKRPRVAIGDFGYRRHKGHVEPSVAHQKDRVSGSTVEQFQLHAWPLFPVAVQQLRQKAGSDCRGHAHADASARSAADHAGGLYRIVELLDSIGDMHEKEASSLSEPHPSMSSLKQPHAQRFLQCANTLADRGLADAKSDGGMAKVQVLPNGYGMNQCRKRNPRAEHLMLSGMFVIDLRQFSAWPPPHSGAPWSSAGLGRRLVTMSSISRCEATSR
ncbi:hypothetical protein KL86PLE_41373 [uncultured Pleomorphomonas sp.]|uniref:Uncharacterized protein n=1 Tax=uncultured Pleomorphomonas sp. TaxID=442121 RepID=A0A212LJ48_9HYPH|nr:hypothetical protein KL86PLE_41373 [uncultured Pleomorphomonas sp.]